MKNKKSLAWAIPAGVLTVGGVLVYLAAPGRADRAQKAPFMGANIAHRGLHSADGSVPENSLAAFAAAAEAGYGVELDVHLTADGRLAVIHDSALERMCGVAGRVEALPWNTLQRFYLGGSDQRIPSLEAVLDCIDGRVPIVLELKHCRDMAHNERLCRAVRTALTDYRGDICIESFDPRIVRWWRKQAPDLLRGQLSNPMEQFHGLPRAVAFVHSRLLCNFLGRPQFVAYGLGGKRPWTLRLCRAMGAMSVAWTSRDCTAERDHDMVIFEHYRPARRFR